MKGGLSMEGSIAVFVDFIAQVCIYAIGGITVYLLGLYYC